MTFRRRLGVLATAVSGLLAAGLLLSAPAFAWSADITRLEVSCPPGSDTNLVVGTVTLNPSDDSGRIEVWYRIGETGDFTRDGTETFNPGQQLVDFHFSVPSPDTENVQIAVKTVTFFDSLPENEAPPEDVRYANLEKCKGEETTPTQPTTPPTQPTQPPETTPTAAPTTAALGKAATTVAANKLPFTGSNAVPMLIAALVLVVGGGGLLFASRFRSRQAK
jgi:hypothetical protein